MSQWAKARIQLSGRYVVDIDGCRIEDTLPGHRGRVLFAYLVLHRARPVSRDELLVAGFGERRPPRRRETR
jgi:DNA-binding SARP family transcriptional activator